MQFENLDELAKKFDFQECLNLYTRGAKLINSVAFDKFNKKNLSTIRYERDCGVYLLIRFVNKWDVLFYGRKPLYEVCYIGITNNFYNRMNQHRNDKEFDYVVLLLIDKPYARDYESSLIKELNPPLNRTHNDKNEQL